MRALMIASAEILLTPFHVSGMARYALRRVSAQIATQWLMAWFPRHVQPWAIDGLTGGILMAGSSLLTPYTDIWPHGHDTYVRVGA